MSGKSKMANHQILLHSNPPESRDWGLCRAEFLNTHGPKMTDPALKHYTHIHVSKFQITDHLSRRTTQRLICNLKLSAATVQEITCLRNTKNIKCHATDLHEGSCWLLQAWAEITPNICQNKTRSERLDCFINAVHLSEFLNWADSSLWNHLVNSEF